VVEVNLKYFPRPLPRWVVVQGDISVHRLAEHLADQVVEHAEPGQPADDSEAVAEHDREVVVVGRAATRRHEAAGVMKLPSQWPR
jgi:hypothetical protein